LTKIITFDSSLPVKGFTWDHSWIFDYESAWSVFEKFKFFNSFSDADLFRLFGTEVIKQKKSKTWSKKNRDLYSLNAFDDFFTNHILGISIKEVTKVINEGGDAMCIKSSFGKKQRSGM